MRLPECSLCGGTIGSLGTSVADSIREVGGIVVDPSGVLSDTLYAGHVCEKCMRIYCDRCHDTLKRGHNCPKCGVKMWQLSGRWVR